MCTDHSSDCKCENCASDLQKTRKIVMSRLDKILATIPAAVKKDCETTDTIEEARKSITETMLRKRPPRKNKKSTFFQQVVVQ